MATKLYRQLVKLKPEFAEAAQEVYDAWDQSHEEGDPILGFGGICQDIAEALSNVVIDNLDADVEIMDTCGIEDQHVWVVAYTENEAYHIDIHPSVYETGSGYVWYKILDVEIQPRDISIWEAEDFEPLEDAY